MSALGITSIALGYIGAFAFGVLYGLCSSRQHREGGQ